MTFNYSNLRPIDHLIAASRQAAKRHYGVHPYFTRRPPNVVRSYIEHFSKIGDRVLDPFGGSGVTAIEAFLSSRHGIHNDINPLGNFIASHIVGLAQGDLGELNTGFDHMDAVCGDFVRRIPQMDDHQVEKELQKLELPRNIPLPSNSDVEFYHELFTRRQLLALTKLREAVDGVRNRNARAALLIAWSATLAKLNRTFLSAKDRLVSRGGSSIFSIYRYKIAQKAIELPPWPIFAERFANILRAKEEVLREKLYWVERKEWMGRFEHYCADVSELPSRIDPVDYIFTDPPYGGHIAYLDLSTLWNHWLGLKVPVSARKQEIIVGGEQKLTEDHYIRGLSQSIKTCFHLLKKDRWLSVVFQHWNIRYFEAMLETARECGGTLRAAVTQAGDTIWSMHKKKNRDRVLSGEMILTFKKEQKSKHRQPTNQRLEIEQLVDLILPSAVNTSNALQGEVLFNRLITEAWNRDALKSLNVGRDEFLDLLSKRGWLYDPESHSWHKERPAHRQAALAFT